MKGTLIMTVKDLKELLAIHNDSDEILYFDIEAGEDVHMHSDWISFEENKWEKTDKEI